MFSKIVAICFLISSTIFTNVSIAATTDYKQMSCQQLEEKIQEDKGILEALKKTINEFKDAWNKFLYCLTSDDLRCIPGAGHYTNVSWDLFQSQIKLNTKTSKDLELLNTEFKNRCQ